MPADVSMEDALGIGRVVDPPGVLPQQATRLDPALPLRSGELAIDVDYLNVDSASWRQLRDESRDDPVALSRRIAEIVAGAGKLHNPVTGSGGMLVGTVSQLGPGRVEPPVGTRVATLVSLTATPLELQEIVVLDPTSEMVGVRARAVLFAGSPFAVLPPDLDERIALAAFDVCGAPAWIERLARPGARVLVIGAGGKSGLLCVAQALRSVGPDGTVLGACWPPETAAEVEELGAAVAVVDATRGLDVAREAEAALGGRADVVAVCANVPGCEAGAILAAADTGQVVFFSMATSFTRAALTAEALARPCTMLIGNGYVPGHAELTLELLRSEPPLLHAFERRCVTESPA